MRFEDPRLQVGSSARPQIGTFHLDAKGPISTLIPKPPTFHLSHHNVIHSVRTRFLLYSQFTTLTLSRSFRNLPQKTRLGVGLAFLAWGTIGLYISDNAEKKLGFEATEKDKEALGSVVPRITMVEREDEGGS